MAAYNKFDDFVEQLGKGVHHLHAAGDVLKVYLSSTAPSQAGDAVKADCAEFGQSGSGYTAGGQDIQNDYTETSGTGTLTAVDVVWTATAAWTGNPFEYVVTYNDTASSPTDPLVCWHTYPSGPLTLGINETFTVDYSTSLATIGP